MAKIYKFEGYILDPNGYDIDVEELKIWKKIVGVFTPGGDTAYKCPVCGEGFHIYGIESSEPHRRCRDCGVELFYPWEVK